jgi:predicted acylesterase/phospholipase RssA
MTSTTDTEFQSAHQAHREPPAATQPRVGLVLGAGGIRGCAHAGVIKVLREQGIPIDLVVGASIGSIFGLALAAGWPTERIVQGALDATPRTMFRFYAGRLRTEARNPIARMLCEVGQDRDFSDLPLPFAVVATDMHTGQPTVIDRGPVLPAIRASIALPLVARPVALGDSVYVDGGLFDTIPTYVARQMGADLVIAVCLGCNFTAPRFLRRRPWTRSHLERLGKQRRPATTGLRDQLRFGCRLFAASFDPPSPSHDADIAIWPEFGGLSPNSIFGARFCFDQGVAAAKAVDFKSHRALSGELWASAGRPQPGTR